MFTAGKPASTVTATRCSCGAACQAARDPEGTPLTGAPGGLPTRRRLPACPTSVLLRRQTRQPPHALQRAPPQYLGKHQIPVLPRRLLAKAGPPRVVRRNPPRRREVEVPAARAHRVEIGRA